MAILVGKKQISQYTGRSFSPTILRWIEEKGFPARKIDGVWHSDKELIKWWFRLQLCQIEGTPYAPEDLLKILSREKDSD